MPMIGIECVTKLQEHEDADWSRAEDLVKTGGREEVELISSSTRGFVVSTFKRQFDRLTYALLFYPI